MIAAARAGVRAVEVELFRAEPRVAGVFVNAGGDRDQLIPALGRLDVHFDHAGIGRHLEVVDPVIVRRLVAFDDDRRSELRPPCPSIAVISSR